MKTYVILMRGINVGGKNKILMLELKKCLEELGYAHVRTYIASGNVILESDKRTAEIKTQIEQTLPNYFKLDSKIVKVLVQSRSQIKAVIDSAPKGFGTQPDKYHSDVIFLMGIDLDQSMAIFNPREGVDKVWPGNGVIYSQRLSSERTKSRLGKIIGTPPYQFMTIRSWNTMTKLLTLSEISDAEQAGSLV